MNWLNRIPFRVRKACLLIWWPIMFGLTHWPDIDDFDPGMPDNFDKVVHFCMYALWAALWIWMLSVHSRRLTRVRIMWILIGGAAYAIFDEATQAIVARTPDVIDFSCDVLGIAASCVLMRMILARSQPAAAPVTYRRLEP